MEDDAHRYNLGDALHRKEDGKVNLRLVGQHITQWLLALTVPSVVDHPQENGVDGNQSNYRSIEPHILNNAYKKEASGVVKLIMTKRLGAVTGLQLSFAFFLLFQFFKLNKLFFVLILTNGRVSYQFIVLNRLHLCL